MKAKSKNPAPKTVPFTILLTEEQLRRLEFVAYLDGVTPQSLAAAGVVDRVECIIEDGCNTDDNSRDETVALAEKLNAVA